MRISRSTCCRSSSPTLLPTICARSVDATYTAAAFGDPRDHAADDPRARPASAALSNGPTLAFKDIALQLLGNLFEHVLRDSARTLNILGATSGDTGSSAEYAMRGKRDIAVFMLSPHGRMSAFQQAQMYALDDPNIHNLAIEGTFDDCQDIVKAIAADAAFKRAALPRRRQFDQLGAHRRPGRLLLQRLLCGDVRERRAGELRRSVRQLRQRLAGHVAKQMGLPIAQLIVATNENDVLDEFFRTGRYRAAQRGRDARDVVAVDGHLAGVELRALHVRHRRARSGAQGAVGAALERRRRHVSGTLMWARVGRPASFPGTARTPTASRRSATPRRYGVVIDPHTADGVKVGARPGAPACRSVETALPAKFAATIREALGFEPPRPAAFDGIEDLPEAVRLVAPADVAAVKACHRQRLSERTREGQDLKNVWVPQVRVQGHNRRAVGRAPEAWPAHRVSVVKHAHQ